MFQLNAPEIDEKAPQSVSMTTDVDLHTRSLTEPSEGLSGEIEDGFTEFALQTTVIPAPCLSSMTFREIVSYFMSRIGMSAREIGRRGVCERHLFEHPHKERTLRRLSRVLCLSEREEEELMRAASEFRREFEQNGSS